MTTAQADWNLEEHRGAVANGAAVPVMRFPVKTLAEMFDEAAAAHGDRIAVTLGDERLSYRELQAQAERLGARLRGLGVGPEKLVGVYLERTPTAIVALVAILKAGGAYLPLDPAYPGERVAAILEDARPVVLLTDVPLFERIPERLRADGAQVVLLDADAGMESDKEVAIDSKIAPDATAGNLAYVIYTSGSTGKPKGVMVTHANVSRLLTATAGWFGFNQEDVWTVFHSLAFDFSVWEVWGCLLHGGRLAIVPFAVSRSPEDFYELLLRERVTVLNQTPSAFYPLIAEDSLRKSPDLALRVVIFGGEALNFRALRPWFETHGSRSPRLVNMYGITETTVHVTYREVAAEDAAGGAHSLIGVPIPDLAIYLLGADGEPAPAGEVGEIYVGGAGVARGYLNRPELNAERFLDDPFTAVPGARMYRSGDLARYLPDGELEYLGRGDDQVKINGFRIELGEVEAAIVSHAGVREARVVAHTDAAGTKRLAAYYVGAQGAALSTEELSQFLAEKLPPWMRPSVYLRIEDFPLTPHGKVDYAALPQPTTGSAGGGTEAAGSNLEREVADLWRQALGAERVGLDDNFFDIGGTSLLLVSVHGKLQKLLQRKIDLADLFGYATVRALAGRLSEGGVRAESPAAPASPAAMPAQDRAQKQREAFARARGVRRPL